MKGAGMGLITLSDVKLPVEKDEKELIQIGRASCRERV